MFVTCVDIGLNNVVSSQRGFASVEYSTGRNPFFGFKFEVRGAKINPTSLLVVSFETIDKSNKQPRFAGHSFFPLFMDKVSKLPITE